MNRFETARTYELLTSNVFKCHCWNFSLRVSSTRLRIIVFTPFMAMCLTWKVSIGICQIVCFLVVLILFSTPWAGISGTYEQATNPSFARSVCSIFTWVAFITCSSWIFSYSLLPNFWLVIDFQCFCPFLDALSFIKNVLLRDACAFIQRVDHRLTATFQMFPFICRRTILRLEPVNQAWATGWSRNLSVTCLVKLPSIYPVFTSEELWSTVGKNNILSSKSLRHTIWQG